MCCGKFFILKYICPPYWFFLQDAVLAAEAGVEGIIISNHGGEHFVPSLP